MISYKIIEFLGDIDRGTIYPIEWNKVPDEVLDRIPEKYLVNNYGVTEDGNIINRTVLYVEPCKRKAKTKTESGLLSDDIELVWKK